MNYQLKLKLRSSTKLSQSQLILLPSLSMCILMCKIGIRTCCGHLSRSVFLTLSKKSKKGPKLIWSRDHHENVNFNVKNSKNSNVTIFLINYKLWIFGAKNSKCTFWNVWILGSLSCPLHSAIRHYIFGSDRDMGFNPQKKIAHSISMTFGIRGESLCLCFEYYSPVLSLASLELLSLKTTLLSWH